MANYVLLNNVDHKDLKIVTRHSTDFGHSVGSVFTFPTEYGDIQRVYPILFRQDPDSGDWQSVAILGLQKDENLFLDEEGWHASYIPGMIARGPFMIGFQQQEVDGESRRERVIHVDMDDPRISETEGEPVFLEFGGNSPYLEQVADILGGIDLGIEFGKAMFEAFEACELIEPVSIKIDVHEDLQYNFTGFHTISEDKLSQLDGDTLQKLNQSGFLQPAFLVLASLNNVKSLIEMKRKSILSQSG